MNKYAYKGPVMVFDRCVTSCWKSETMADTITKAKSNLMYQYKKKNNLVPSTKVSLPGDIILV